VIIAVGLIVIAQLLRVPIDALPPTTRADNVLLTGIPFIMTFIAIVLLFVFAIFGLAKILNGRISRQLHSIIETILILGVFGGVFGMFQGWAIIGYQIGFYVLLFCFLAFNVWTHITPKSIRRKEAEHA
jgi:lysylphosphatidylglycerol synthetase-like protein (DUF2156 family)